LKNIIKKEGEMSKLKRLLCFFVLVACIDGIAGCTGHLYMFEEPKFDAKGKIDGIIVYLPQSWIVTYETTQLVDKDGKIIGSAEKKTCSPVKDYEIVNVPDYSKKYAIVYKPGLLESSKFSLTLEKGVINSVNVDATSAAKETLETLAGILSVAKQAAAFAPKAEEAPPKACNAGRKLIAIEPFKPK
jgi:hypothetical protein